MATPLENWSRVEVRSVIRFLTAKGLKPIEIHTEIKSVYGEKVMAKSQVYEWCSKFKAGHTDVNDKVHPGPCFLPKLRTTNKARQSLGTVDKFSLLLYWVFYLPPISATGSIRLNLPTD